MAEQKKGQIRVFAKNIRGISHGGILEESKFTRNFAGGKHVQNGQTGGVNNDKNNPRKEPLLVKKIDGPYDPKTRKKVDIIEKEKRYNYKIVQYSRIPTGEEKKQIKWAIRYDDGGIAYAPNVNGLENISFFVSEQHEVSKIRVYAYFQQPVENVRVETYTIKEEVLIIIGTEQHSTNSANKLMFGGQAVREVRTKFSKYPFLTVALFTDGYSEKQITAMNSALLKQNIQANVIQINTVDQLINIINSGNQNSSSLNPKRKVKTIYAFAHGYVRKDTNEGVIAFGYEGKNALKQELDSKNFVKINKSVFLASNKSIFYSYACRTGIGTSSEVTSEPLMSKSLAQSMANYGEITVFAYMRRSLYEDTWGTQSHRDTYASDNDAGDTKWENFKTDIKDLISPDPKDMSNFTKYRKKEIKIDGAIWNSEGAYIGVKAGSWPKGVPATYNKYISK